MSNPLTTTATAEAALINNLNGLAAALDRVGTDHLAAAVGRVHTSAAKAADRLKTGMAASMADVLGVADLINTMNALLTADMNDAVLIDLSLPPAPPCLLRSSRPLLTTRRLST